MINTINKNVFNSDAAIIAQLVDAKGNMTIGIEKEIKTKYPMVYKTYNKVCESYSYDNLVGKIQVLHASDNLKIANLFAESDGGKVDCDALRICLQKLNQQKTSIAIPYGIGYVEGKWVSVLQVIEEELKDCDVMICSPEPIETNNPPKLVIENLAKRGTGYVDGKQRVMKMFADKLSKQEIVKKLADEYGIGGYSGTRNAFGIDYCMYDSSGIDFEWHDEDNEKYKSSMSWSQMYEAIKSVVVKGDYLNDKEEDRYHELYGTIESISQDSWFCESTNYEQQNLFGFVN